MVIGYYNFQSVELTLYCKTLCQKGSSSLVCLFWAGHLGWNAAWTLVRWCHKLQIKCIPPIPSDTSARCTPKEILWSFCSYWHMNTCDCQAREVPGHGDEAWENFIFFLNVFGQQSEEQTLYLQNIPPNFRAILTVFSSSPVEAGRAFILIIKAGKGYTPHSDGPAWNEESEN